MPSVLLRRGNQVAGWTPAMASVLAEACFVQEMAFYRINRYHPDIMLMLYAIDNRMEATPRGFLPSGKFLAAIVENTCRIPGQRNELDVGFSNTREIHLMNIYLTCICALTGYWHSAVMVQPDEAQERAAIVASVRSYVQAFNERDAKAVSEHWSTDGELVEPNGSLLIGKAAIEDSFEKLFAGLLPSQTLSIRIERISFVTPDVAIEEGTAYVVDAWQTAYAATHKKENGRWVVHSVRESTISEVSSHYDHLQPLEWMIGDWIDESEESTIESSCNWSKNRNFIRRNFRVSVRGMEPLEGTQIIGYDAASGNIRSWMFDSDGGWGSGIWTRDGDSWEVRSNQVLADGRTATATNYFQRIGEKQFQWTSRQRQIDGNDLPDTEPVVVQRVAQNRSGN